MAAAAGVGSCGGLVQAGSGGGCVTPFNDEERVAEIRRWLPSDVSVRIGSFCGWGAYACLEGKVVYLPAETLFKAADFPNLPKITGAADPNLFEATCLERFKAECVQLLDPSLHPSVAAGYKVDKLQRLLLALQDPIRYEKDKAFTVAHENAHIQHARGLFGMQIWNQKRCVDKLENAGRSFLRKFIPALPPHSSHSYTVAEEMRSDLDAAKALGDATGGIYGFEVDRDITIARRRNAGWIVPSAVFDEDGQPRPLRPLSPPTHPTDSQRIRYLQEWQECTQQPAALEFPEALLAELAESNGGSGT